MAASPWYSAGGASARSPSVDRWVEAAVLALVIVLLAVLLELATPPTLTVRYLPVVRPPGPQRTHENSTPQVCTEASRRSGPSSLRMSPRHTPRMDLAIHRVVSEPAASLAVAGTRCVGAT